MTKLQNDELKTTVSSLETPSLPPLSISNDTILRRGAQVLGQRRASRATRLPPNSNSTSEKSGRQTKRNRTDCPSLRASIHRGSRVPIFASRGH